MRKPVNPWSVLVCDALPAIVYRNTAVLVLVGATEG